LLRKVNPTKHKHTVIRTSHSRNRRKMLETR
jgi:hypothetical protein